MMPRNRQYDAYKIASNKIIDPDMVCRSNSRFNECLSAGMLRCDKPIASWGEWPMPTRDRVTRPRDTVVLAMAVTICIGWIAAPCSMSAATSVPVPTFEVDAASIMSTIRELASPRYDGRLAGTDGNWAAVAYVADRFRELGLECPDGLVGYLQHYVQPNRLIHNAPTLEIVDERGEMVTRFTYVTQFTVRTCPGSTMKGRVTAPGVVLHSVSELDSIERRSIVLVPEYIAQSMADMWTITTWLSSPDREACGSFRGLVLETDISSSGYFPVQLSIWDVEDEADDDADDSSEGWAWPMIFSCDVLTFAELLRARNEGMLVRLSADFTIEQVGAANVVGLLRGSAVAPEDGHTIIGAHLDHVGSNMNGTYNPGALDNASGIAAMLEVARVLTSSAEPQPNSVVFIAFNGEEQEMQGSAYYARNPCYPLDGAIMINIDCVGALEPGPLMINEFSAMTTRTVHDLHRLSGRLEIEAEMGSSCASDHAYFALAGIEAIDLTDSGFCSVYHGPFDTPDQIDIERVVEIVRLIAAYACTY